METPILRTVHAVGAETRINIISSTSLIQSVCVMDSLLYFSAAQICKEVGLCINIRFVDAHFYFLLNMC